MPLLPCENSAIVVEFRQGDHYTCHTFCRLINAQADQYLFSFERVEIDGVIPSLRGTITVPKVGKNEDKKRIGYVPNLYLRVSVPGSSHVLPGREYDAEILPDGSISRKICLDEGGWFDNKTDHIFDEGLVIPGIDRVIKEAKRLHPRVSYFKWIGWDFTVDKEGDPLLIELNASPGDHAQRVCGRPLFGDMTDWVLEDYFVNRSLAGNKMPGSWCTNDDITRYNG